MPHNELFGPIKLPERTCGVDDHVLDVRRDNMWVRAELDVPNVADGVLETGMGVRRSVRGNEPDASSLPVDASNTRARTAARLPHNENLHA
jgi:hypothetical protein